MVQRKPLPYRDLRSKLKEFGVEEKMVRGKGSERLFIVSIPLPQVVLLKLI